MSIQVFAIAILATTIGRHMLTFFKDLSKEDIAKKAGYFKPLMVLLHSKVANGVNVQLKEEVVSYWMGIHCMAHCTNWEF